MMLVWLLVWFTSKIEYLICNKPSVVLKYVSMSEAVSLTPWIDSSYFFCSHSAGDSRDQANNVGKRSFNRIEEFQAHKTRAF